MSIWSTRWLACLLVLFTSHAFAADRPWRMVVTPQYRLLSQLRDGETNGWMRNFDQFILSTTDVLQVDPKALPPLTVVIFDRDQDYTPYKSLGPSGQVASVAGEFVRHPTWSMIGMAHEKDNAQLRRILSHEATHWLMSAEQARQPAWYVEGIAEMLSTFERHGGKVDWGKPIASHLELLRRSGTLPLAQFLTEPSALFDRDERTERFYAQSWLFTHFLMLSKESSRRPLLTKFLHTFRSESGEATVDAVFGPAIKDVERDFNLYVEQSTYAYMTLPVKPADNPPPLQSAPPALVEASLGFLALGAGHDDLARTHAEKAVVLDTKVPDGHAVLAYLALDKGDFDGAAAHAEAALQHGSKDSDLFMLLGDSYLQGRNSRKPDAAQARVSLYESAINLTPQRLATYERLSEALFAVDKPSDEDSKFLALGLRTFPGEDWLRVGSAVVDYRLGRRDVAMSMIDTALRTESTLDGGQRAYATNLRGRWLVDAMKTAMEAPLNKNDFAAARAIVSRYRIRIGGNADFTAFFDETDKSLELRELLNQYDVALRANKRGDARSIANRLLAMPDLPASSRRYLQQSGRGAN